MRHRAVLFLFSIFVLLFSTKEQAALPCCQEWSAYHSGVEQPVLNRLQDHHLEKLPPIPQQTRNYLHITNYNIRTAYKDRETDNGWQKRQKFFLQTLQYEDEARQMMEEMRSTLELILRKHFSPQHLIEEEGESQRSEKKKTCTTCNFADRELFPIIRSRFFRIALKCQQNNEGEVVGNFPYPNRMIIALKRHSSFPSTQEWEELRLILETLQSRVCQELGAQYSSYSLLQDVHYKKLAKGEVVPEEPHFFLHFIFRFPSGLKVRDVLFHDPNPYDQFVLRYSNIIAPSASKPQSSHIYRKMPDMINTQELTYEQTQDLKKALPNYGWVGYTAHQGLPVEEVAPDTWIGEIVAIAFNRARLECLSSGMRWLSATSETRSVVPGASRERIIIWGLFRDKVTGHSFYMFNTHYDHFGQRQLFVESEQRTIKAIAGDQTWFSVGERFYKEHEGEFLYHHYTNNIDCRDVRDCSLLGHYGQAGSWGGFADDSYAASVKEGVFSCDTLDVCFTNQKRTKILFTYTITGAYNPLSQELYPIDLKIESDYRLASDHFMTGFYLLLE